MQLHYDEYGEGKPLFILHGLFGSASNFRSLAKVFAAHMHVFCVDLRNHGQSPHGEDICYDTLAKDVIRLVDHIGADKINILGHSMGGKVAMQCALTYPDRIDSLIVGDIAPVYYPPHHSEIFAAFRAVDEAGIIKRNDAETIMRDYVDDSGVRMFLLSNLRCDPDGRFRWRLNYPVLSDHYDDIAAAPEGYPFDGKTLFIRGGRSEYIPTAYEPAIYDLFPAAAIETIAGAGHWLHAEKPVEFTNIIEKFIKAD
ncbi:MAG: alpha/beta hydrolase [Kordiimonas sp.]|nr:alpha/beta hydrolase [Kordiimonas sp.]